MAKTGVGRQAEIERARKLELRAITNSLLIRDWSCRMCFSHRHGHLKAIS
jgi:hypothetical protein